MILDEILKNKRKELERLKRRFPPTKLEQRARQSNSPKRSFLQALRSSKHLHLICELKQASPSEGLLRRNFKPLELARAFESGGASAISVLTETKYFRGDPETLKQVRPVTTIPILRKDFIFEPYQIYETAILSADAFLLITAIVNNGGLKHLIHLGRELGLESLVEVHTEEETERALKAGAQVIGINSRDLKTLALDRSVPERLVPLVPKRVLTVIESGINSPLDIARYQALGANCFLIGTALMRSSNIGKKMAEFRGEET